MRVAGQAHHDAVGMTARPGAVPVQHRGQFRLQGAGVAFVQVQHPAVQQPHRGVRVTRRAVVRGAAGGRELELPVTHAEVNAPLAAQGLPSLRVRAAQAGHVRRVNRFDQR